ncbi:collagen alpha-5(IV) chain-like [Choloepus didactylus]|uniref:collagen alpha-5(IV) chain-like n=1 Tax=Choloepus didactylus TaxID=27675 RepID=UPI00189C9113|nr:collagen alpha-5(IV) chain-like [Choloepus didactylus]
MTLETPLHASPAGPRPQHTRLLNERTLGGVCSFSLSCLERGGLVGAEGSGVQAWWGRGGEWPREGAPAKPPQAGAAGPPHSCSHPPTGRAVDKLSLPHPLLGPGGLGLSTPCAQRYLLLPSSRPPLADSNRLSVAANLQILDISYQRAPLGATLGRLTYFTTSWGPSVWKCVHTSLLRDDHSAQTPARAPALGSSGAFVQLQLPRVIPEGPPSSVPPSLLRFTFPPGGTSAPISQSEKTESERPLSELLLAPSIPPYPRNQSRPGNRALQAGGPPASGEQLPTPGRLRPPGDSARKPRSHMRLQPRVTPALTAQGTARDHPRLGRSRCCSGKGHLQPAAPAWATRGVPAPGHKCRAPGAPRVSSRGGREAFPLLPVPRAQPAALGHRPLACPEGWGAAPAPTVAQADGGLAGMGRRPRKRRLSCCGRNNSLPLFPHSHSGVCLVICALSPDSGLHGAPPAAGILPAPSILPCWGLMPASQPFSWLSRDPCTHPGARVGAFQFGGANSAVRPPERGHEGPGRLPCRCGRASESVRTFPGPPAELLPGDPGPSRPTQADPGAPGDGRAGAPGPGGGGHSQLTGETWNIPSQPGPGLELHTKCQASGPRRSAPGHPSHPGDSGVGGPGGSVGSLTALIWGEIWHHRFCGPKLGPGEHRLSRRRK